MSKLTIKESGRYANFLDKTLDKLTGLAYRGLESQLYETEEFHKRSESLSGAEDKTIKTEYESIVDISVEDLTELIAQIVVEKASLADKIAEAKKTIAIEVKDNTMNLDSSIEYAKILRKVSNDYLSRLGRLRDSKRVENMRGYSFNVEGNQTPLHIYSAL